MLVELAADDPNLAKLREMRSELWYAAELERANFDEVAAYGTWAFFVLFIIGSIMILWGRYQELKDGN